jgi:23S rRNA pseudouridine2605 synthase
VEGEPTARQVARVRSGVDLDDGPARAVRARVVAASRGRGAVRLVMTEGRKREVRRLLAAVGLPVTRLVRLRVGPITLDGMSPGDVRPLQRAEIQALTSAASSGR